MCLTRFGSTHGEKIPSHFLELFWSGLNPTFRAKTLSILPEYVLVLVKYPCINSDDRTLWEVNARYSLSTRWNITLEDETNGGVYAEGFIDDCDAI